MDELFITVIIALLTGNVVQFVVGVAMSRDLITIRDKRREALSAIANLEFRLGSAKVLIRERDENIASQTREITVRDGQIAKLTMELQEKTRELLKFIELNQSNLEIKENLANRVREVTGERNDCCNRLAACDATFRQIFMLIDERERQSKYSYVPAVAEADGSPGSVFSSVVDTICRQQASL